jgi:hypothetical protein
MSDAYASSSKAPTVMDEGPKETSIASFFGRSLRRSSSPGEPPCRQIESDREVRVKSLRAALAPAPRGMLQVQNSQSVCGFITICHGRG